MKKIQKNSKDYGLRLFKKKSPNVIIGTIYRHPSQEITNFNKALDTTFKHLSKEKGKLIAITGDFNLDLLKYGQDKKVTIFLNQMFENHFNPCITEPTRIIDINEPYLIDIIFINFPCHIFSGNFTRKDFL